MSQLTVPRKDNSDHRVNKFPGQRPPEEGHLACHRQGRPDPGGPPETGHPLPEKIGGHSRLEQEDGGGSAGDGLPTWEGCPSHHDPPDVLDTGGCLPRVGWALEGITADTRGPPPATHPSVRQKLSLCNVNLFAPTPTPPIHQSRRNASAKKSPVPVVRVTGVWSAPATRAGSVTLSQGTASPPPVKHLKLESGRRDRVKTPGGKTTHKGPRGIAESAVTPPKVGKGQKKSAQPGVSSTAEKGGILPGGRDATTSTVVTSQETTAGVIAQEGTSIVTGQETTAGVIAQEGTSIVTGQETTATAGVIAQEGTSIITGQETTTGVIAQEGTSIVTGQETTTGVIAQEGTSIVTGQETTATAGVSAQEGPGCHSPAGQ
ncbi:hypothetical protein NDU88_003163 [Pleurodeles waltl]|uniref:Uncharacterized protein n=1 Tax=Pleurodeles waltl TaxID=8319 RepID=A0AAV7W579_PLEWA|nr:hypothetical protein NDU88_003163 [Pleurodeles waltl]